MSAINDGIVLHQSPETVDTKRAMFDCSVKRILLADHTKFERRALHSFAALEEFDVVIVDDKTPPVHIDRMRSRDINVVVARTGHGRT
jgi:DeoR/GlpR family transcriptional regulator of sugar metabolism